MDKKSRPPLNKLSNEEEDSDSVDDSDSEYNNIEPNVLVAPPSHTVSDETLREQYNSDILLSDGRHANPILEDIANSLVATDTAPATSTTIPNHKPGTISIKDDLIKSFVLDVSDTPESSDSETHHHRILIGECPGCLNVCMAGENNTSGGGGTFIEMKRRSEQSKKYGSSGSNCNKYDHAGLCGLLNIGNTCFMNSILQCLSNTGPLLRYILHDKYGHEINKIGSSLGGHLLAAFIKLIKELWKIDGNNKVVDTTELKCQLQMFAPRFRGYSQHDSHELLRYLMDALHNELNRIQNKPKYIPFNIDPSWNLAEHSLNAWKNYIRVDNSKIVDIFVGQLKSTLCCSECGYISITFDPFWDLSISIPPPKRLGSSSSGGSNHHITLEQCLESFTKIEILDGDEKPYCNKCECNQKSTKCFTIERFPIVLVIHLKRFKDDEKLRTIVRFPIIGLDIGKYSSSKTNCCSYNLYGISNHSGNISSGHYIAYCKHPYNTRWSCYDDMNVHEVSTENIRNTEAYVLFYEMSEGSKSVLF